MNARLDADVAIVGAGPAGTVTAALIAREGFDVLLVERREFPRPKPCGDCLSPEATRVLERLGILDDVNAATPARLEGWRVVAPSGGMFEACFADICDGDARVASALAIERVRFDAVLLHHAMRAGARFIAPLHVTRLGGRENGARRLEGRIAAGALDRSQSPMTRMEPSAGAATVTIRAPLIIGTDGLRSVVARDINAVVRPPRHRKLSFTAHAVGVQKVTAMGELHVTAGACVGLARVGTSREHDPIDHALRSAEPRSQRRAPTEGSGVVCNVTLVVESDRFGRAAAADPPAFFASMIERFPALRGRFRKARLSPLLPSGSFDRPVRRIVSDDVALAGDAAGYVDPFTGQGIYHALVGAEMLAHAVCRALRRGSAAGTRAELRDYARRYGRLIRPAHRVQRLIDEVLRRPAIADAAITRLAHRPAAARALLAVTGDVRRPGSLLSPALLLSLARPI